MKLSYITSLLAITLSVCTLEAEAASKKAKVTVATLAGTYSCLYVPFSDPNDTKIKDLSIVISKTGGVTGTGTTETTDSSCDQVTRDDCTTARSFSFKMPKLATPKKKLYYHQSTLKKTTIDPVSGFTINGIVKTFAGATRIRQIEGIASLGRSGNSLATSLSCYGPETRK